MIRGTTPTHSFTLPSAASNYSDILISYVQNGKIILEKHKNDLVIQGSTVSFKMTGEEANLFAPSEAKVQIKTIASDGTIKASNIIHFGVQPVLSSKGLISDQELFMDFTIIFEESKDEINVNFEESGGTFTIYDFSISYS